MGPAHPWPLKIREKKRPTNSSSARSRYLTSIENEDDISLSVRLGVYSGFGIIQTVFVVLMTLQFASGGELEVQLK